MLDGVGRLGWRVLSFLSFFLSFLSFCHSFLSFFLALSAGPFNPFALTFESDVQGTKDVRLLN